MGFAEEGIEQLSKRLRTMISLYLRQAATPYKLPAWAQAIRSKIDELKDPAASDSALLEPPPTGDAASSAAAPTDGAETVASTAPRLKRTAPKIKEPPAKIHRSLATEDFGSILKKPAAKPSNRASKTSKGAPETGATSGICGTAVARAAATSVASERACASGRRAREPGKRTCAWATCIFLQLHRPRRLKGSSW